MSDLARDVLMLAELANEIAADVETIACGFLTEEELHQLMTAWSLMEEISRTLSNARRDLGDRLGEAMPGKMVIVPNGVGPIEKHSRKDTSTKCTDDDGLWRLTLDTRLVDELTGEIMPQAEVIRRVYGSESKETGRVRLTGSSPGKAQAVFGAEFDPDEFFAKGKHVGWNLRRLG